MSLYSSPLSSSEGDYRSLLPEASWGGIDLRLSLVRGAARLPWRSGPSAAGEDLPASDVLRAARAVSGQPGAFLIGGGEPLRRADLPVLLQELVALRPDHLGLCAAGPGITTAVVHRLRSAGVQRLTVPFHSARRDAHDWLVGQPGALKVALRAIRTSLDAGMPVTAEIVVTRPTMAHLAETVDVLAHVGVRTLCVRRLTALDVGPPEFIGLSPRMSLLAGDLERAAARAIHRRARLVIRDFPLCVAPRLRRLFAGPNDEIWLTAEGAGDARVTGGPRCQPCPGPPACTGAPMDYVSRFGWEEIADPAPKAARVQETVVDQQRVPPSGTMVFSWSGPRRVRCDACADQDAIPGPESTRAVRERLVDAAHHRPAVLRLVGAELLAHPSAAALLFDAVRLFPRVECAGEGSAIAGWKDAELARLKPLHRLDVAFYGADATTHDSHCGIPGSFAATLRGVARLREQTSITVGAYAVIHDASSVRLFADAWSRGVLPGPPRFRLGAGGSSLEALVECARELPPGAARAALLAVLPRCQSEAAGVCMDDDSGVGSPEAEGPTFGVAFGRCIDWVPCGSDPLGGFARCEEKTCAVNGCPGTALGWERGARSERWMLNS